MPSSSPPAEGCSDAHWERYSNNCSTGERRACQVSYGDNRRFGRLLTSLLVRGKDVHLEKRIFIVVTMPIFGFG